MSIESGGGIIFGEARAMHHGEHVSVFKARPESLTVTVMIQMFRGDVFLKFKPAELIKLRDALTAAIEHMESTSNE